MSEAHPRDRLRRTLSLHDATLLVVASVIGSGIFLTPGAIADRLPHPGLILGVWAAGGLLSLAGALANAELAAMFPHAGGDYVYLREAFHPAAGFVAGWLSFFAIFAGTVAALAVGFAAASAPLLGLGAGAVVPLAVATVAACSALNYVSVRAGAWANNVTGWIKVGALLVFAMVGPFAGGGNPANLRPLLRGVTEVATPAALALALSPVLFSYLGWNASVFVASEIREPARNVPRSLFLGLAIVIGVYLVVNAVYLYALPVAALRHTANAGEGAARVLFGELGGRLVTGFVLVSILGTLNATILVGPRIAYAMALDRLFLPGVDRVHESFFTPGVAVVVQAAFASVLLVLLRSFPSALDFTTFCIVLATIADAAALFALRVRQPGRARPYRAWGYPGVPALYLASNFAIALGLLVGRPLEALAGLAVLAAALPCYALLARRAASAENDRFPAARPEASQEVPDDRVE
jgi:APA family basic amino acid/polyamine antiporter